MSRCCCYATGPGANIARGISTQGSNTSFLIMYLDEPYSFLNKTTRGPRPSTCSHPSGKPCQVGTCTKPLPVGHLVRYATRLIFLSKFHWQRVFVGVRCFLGGLGTPSLSCFHSVRARKSGVFFMQARTSRAKQIVLSNEDNIGALVCVCACARARSPRAAIDRSSIHRHFWVWCHSMAALPTCKESMLGTMWCGGNHCLVPSINACNRAVTCTTLYTGYL